MEGSGNGKQDRTNHVYLTSHRIAGGRWSCRFHCPVVRQRCRDLFGFFFVHFLAQQYRQRTQGSQQCALEHHQRAMGGPHVARRRQRHDTHPAQHTRHATLDRTNLGSPDIPRWRHCSWAEHYCSKFGSNRMKTRPFMQLPSGMTPVRANPWLFWQESRVMKTQPTSR